MAVKKAQKKKGKGKKEQESSVAVLKTVVKVLLIVLICLLVYMAVTGAYRFGYKVFNKTGMDPEPGKTVEVTVEKGSSALEVGKLLEQKGLIEDKWVFAVQKIFYGDAIYPGTYEFNTSMSSQQMLKIMNVKPAQEETKKESSGNDSQEAPSEEKTGGGQ